MGGRVYVRPLLPLTAALVVGIAFGEWIPGHSRCFFWMTIAFSVACCYRFFIQNRIRTGIQSPGYPTSNCLPLLLFVSLGYLSVQPWTAPVFPAHHISRYADQGRCVISGKVLEISPASGDRLRVDIEAESVEIKESSLQVTGNLRLTLGDGNHPPMVGDRIRFSGRIRTPRNFKNPGAFDYQRFLAFQGIWATSYADNLLSVDPLNGSSWLRMMDRIRGAVSAAIDRSVSESAGSILKALVIGDTRDIPLELRESFNRTGTGHLLAISGLHVGMVAVGFFFLARTLFSFIPEFLYRAWTGKAAALTTLFPVVSYGLISGMAPGTQRAVIMGGMLLAAVIVYRVKDSVNTLAVAVLGILAWHPPALFSISFQLSALSVAFIIAGVPSGDGPKAAPRSSIKGRVVFHLKSAWQVSFMATLGTLPLIMYYFNSMSFVGLVVNLAAVPVIGGIVVPMGLFSSALLFLWEPLGLWGFKWSGWILAKAIGGIQWAAAWPFSAAGTVTPSGFEIALYYLTLGCLLFLHRNRSSLIQIDPLGKYRLGGLRGKLIIGMVVALVVGWICDIGYWVHRRFWHSELRVTILDVGQGAAALVEFPGGSVAMVDGGGFNDNQVFDIGKNVLAPYLWQNKIRAVDTVILSHPNADHLNGLLFILDHFNVKKFWSNGQSADTEGYRLLKEILAKQRIETPTLDSMDRRITINGVSVEILHPKQDTGVSLQGAAAEKDANNDSLVVKVTYGGHSVLFPGDIESQGEMELSEDNGDRLWATVLVAPHHGSRSSSTSRFLQDVSPEWVVVPCGKDNRFGFPAPEVMSRYRTMGAKVLTTSENGAVFIKMNGAGIFVSPFSD
jgi:competence protein ComEC